MLGPKLVSPIKLEALGGKGSWVARLVGLDPKYVFEREFVRRSGKEFLIRYAGAYQLKAVTLGPGYPCADTYIIIEHDGHIHQADQFEAKDYVATRCSAPAASAPMPVLTTEEYKAAGTPARNATRGDVTLLRVAIGTIIEFARSPACLSDQSPILEVIEEVLTRIEADYALPPNDDEETDDDDDNPF